jgi:hypothetical protein
VGKVHDELPRILLARVKQKSRFEGL